MHTIETKNPLLYSNKASEDTPQNAFQNIGNDLYQIENMLTMAAELSGEGLNQKAADLLSGKSPSGPSLSSLISDMTNNLSLLSGTSYASYIPYFSAFAAECTTISGFSPNEYSPELFARMQGISEAFFDSCGTLSGGTGPYSSQMSVLIDLGELVGLSSQYSKNNSPYEVNAILQASVSLANDLNQIDPPLDPKEQAQLASVQEDITNFLANPSNAEAIALAQDAAGLISSICSRDM